MRKNFRSFLSVLSVVSVAIVAVALWSLFPIYPQAKPNRIQKPAMEEPKDPLKARLTPEQFFVTQQKGTEAPFTGKYWNHHEAGMYRCVVCGADLFASQAKFDSGCGWPSFDKAANDTNVDTQSDTSHGMVRRNHVQQVRGPSGPRVQRWPDGHGAAVLREQRIAGL